MKSGARCGSSCPFHSFRPGSLGKLTSSSITIDATPRMRATTTTLIAGAQNPMLLSERMRLVRDEEAAGTN